MKNVLHLINSLEVGGAEMLLKDSLNGFVKQGYLYKHYVYPVIKEGGALENDFCEEVELLTGKINNENLLSKIIHLRKIIKDKKIDIIHAHLYEAKIISRLIANKNIKVINTYHTGFQNPYSIEFSKKRLWLDRLTKHKCDQFIFVSRSIMEQTLPFLKVKEKSFVVPNFANENFYSSYQFNSESKLKLVSVGNLREQKNHQLLLKSLLPLSKERIQVDIYGEGHLREPLQNQINEHGLPVKLKGKAKISSELLSQYDAYVMTSLHEGMPVSLIEAIITGMPSILTNIHELKETARDAAIYFEKNDAESLTNTLRMVLNKKSILKELSSKAVELSAEYKIESFLETMDKFYKQ